MRPSCSLAGQMSVQNPPVLPHCPLLARQLLLPAQVPDVLCTDALQERVNDHFLVVDTQTQTHTKGSGGFRAELGGDAPYLEPGFAVRSVLVPSEG